jgi:predicted nuclease of predicted toxin-antitoxin system
MKLLADENFHRAIVRGLLRHVPQLDVVRVQDVGLNGADDPTVLAWAADEARLLLTHDAETLIAVAYERVRANLIMPGVIEVSQDAPIGLVIEDLILLVLGSLPGEWENQVLYIPLQR